MIDTESLTESQWQTAHAIAQTLVKEETDVNELRKVIAFLRASVNQPDAESRFFKYLKILVSNGRQIGHSGRTSDYYRSIDKACSQYLHEQANAHTILQILGWTARLMHYYKEVGPIGEIATPSQTSDTKTPIPVKLRRQTESRAATQPQKFQVGQILDAIVTNIKGKEVTYAILEVIKLTVKEPKKYETLSVGKTVKVEVIELKGDGNPKKIKLVDYAPETTRI